LTVSLPEGWLDDHPYLRSIAAFCGRVDAALSELELAEVAPPDLDACRDDLEAGIPLLSSPNARVDLQPAVAAVGELLRALQTGPLPGPVAGEVASLAAALARSPELPEALVPFLLGDTAIEVPSPGLLRFLGWTTLAQLLRGVVQGVESFAGSRDEERWFRRYCPTCGAGPAMGQIAGTEQARQRLLCCGHCRTRWRWRRTQCPFCENDSHRLAGIKLGGEPALRIDHCTECRGYLKTYVGEGQEQLLLADWTSVHLDLLARGRGLERKATSLYDLDSLAGG